jgi:hypothetical protein
MADKSKCANCGVALSGPYCSNCGQKASDLHRPFWWIMGEFLDSVFSYDSRTFRTLWLLFADPGEFTRRYNSGQRASMLPPFRTFIIATVIFFLLLSATGVALFRFEPTSQPVSELDTVAVEALKREAPGVVIEGGGKVTGMRFEMFAPPPPGGFRSSLSPEQMKQFRAVKVEIDKESANAGADPNEQAWLDWIQALGAKASTGFQRIVEDPLRFNGPLNVWLPRIMLLLVPILALLLALMHWRPKSYYIEHLIFSLHLHTVLFVTLSIVVFAVWLFDGNSLAWAALPIMGVYALMAMIRVYGRGPIWTTVKFLVLSLVYGIVLTISLSTVFLLALSEA